ncbi:MAG TPA: NADPH-dependent assimilatory sulfite reductase hemoprotein subunit [Candidatus Dormibacteraeota bacterium]|nr:NADPH-dependent assimilatory sulfite reductase hemoprotein subunit [Candidatus Dormibacteraeota bacterium]
MCQACGCTPTIDGFSRNESIKAKSNHLRGLIKEELVEDAPVFSDDSEQLLKFHGIYQQDDRDRRKEARAKGLDKHHQLMIRTRIPGGVVSPEAYIAHDDISRRWANGTLRVTTRQDFQLHGVLKGDLKKSIAAINHALLTTLGGCGDVERNIMCCPEPKSDRFHAQVDRAIAAMVAALTPRTRAYHEIWLDGEVVDTSEPEVEDLYGEQYLPRKFKTTVALEGDNCVDIYAHDLAIVALRGEGDSLRGFEVLVGGGLGRTHNKPETFAAVAQPLAFVEPDQIVDMAREVVAVQRDYGNRTNRKHARLKYTIADRGIDWFRDEVQSRLPFELQAPEGLRWRPVDDHLGWHEQGDGKLYLGVYVENGRIADVGAVRSRSGLRRIVDEIRPQVRLTAQQNVILAGIDPGQKARVDELLAEHGIDPVESIPHAIRYAMACPAIPTCGLAVAEAERALPTLIRQISAMLDELGLAEERISFRMSGCPNGCSRPYLGDVGFVGTTLGKYDVMLGGDFDGTRLNRLYAPNLPLAEIPTLLRSIFVEFRSGRDPGERFGDWVQRIGFDALRERVEQIA